jgi:hypothetical protein
MLPPIAEWLKVRMRPTFRVLAERSTGLIGSLPVIQNHGSEPA